MTSNYYIPIDIRFWQKVKFGEGIDDCWEWTGFCFPSGHGQFHMGDRDVKAHRAAWLIYNGTLSSKDYICHKCDNPKCVRLDHLYKGTHQTNQADKIGKYRNREATNVKLNWEKVEAIRELASIPAPLDRENIRGRLPKGLYSSSKIASKFGISSTTVLRVLKQSERGGWRREVPLNG